MQIGKSRHQKNCEDFCNTNTRRTRMSSMCISLVLDTLKIYNNKTLNEYVIQEHAFIQ
jgi:hypothetical protein